MKYRSYSPNPERQVHRAEEEAPVPPQVQKALAILAVREPLENDTWMATGLCSVTDPEIFDEKNGNVELAKAFCKGCVRTEQCLEYALTTHQDSLVWGGLTAAERKKIKRRRPAGRPRGNS